MIRGRKYQFEQDEQLYKGRPRYILTSAKGKKWFTVRNVPKPDMLFLISLNMSKTLERVWLTDKDGKLEVIKE